MRADLDVAVVGGGPAGLATAVFAARAGLTTAVFERSSGPPDKACGEGLMPSGLRVLEALGARAFIEPGECSPFLGVRYVLPDGSAAEGRLAGSGGLGIRRTALSAALARCAGEAGVELCWGSQVKSFVRAPEGIVLDTSAGEVTARFVVAADGVNSKLRQLAGLEDQQHPSQRFGMRQHFRVPPWSPFVEVYPGDGVEAYVTPTGPCRVGIAFLWEKGAGTDAPSVEGFLSSFPALAGRVAGAEPDSRPRGAGPLVARVKARTADRLALVGDAAGCVDAIIGEGVSLALVCAEKLGAALPEVIARGGSRAALAGYQRAVARAFARYTLVSRVVLAAASRPRVLGPVVRALHHHPRVFDRLIALALT